MEKLQELYGLCTSIHISPYNPNIGQEDKRHSVRIAADVCAKYQYAKINVDAPNLAEAIDRLHYLVTGYAALVENMPR